jgi:hypothetical protein
MELLRRLRYACGNRDLRAITACLLSGDDDRSGRIASGDLDPRHGTAALGFVDAMTGLPQDSTEGGTLHVLAIS